MSKEIEKEERIMLSKATYEKAINYYISLCPYFEKKEIRNDYFDDANFSLTDNHLMLRMRTSSQGKEELTLKIPQKNGDLEITQPLTRNEVIFINKTNQIPEGEVKISLLSLGVKVNELKLITALETLRYSFCFDDCLIEIDMNKYGKKIDYNLEVESSSKMLAKSKIIEICKLFKTKYSNNYQVKSARVINDLRH